MNLQEVGDAILRLERRLSMADMSAEEQQLLLPLAVLAKNHYVSNSDPFGNWDMWQELCVQLRGYASAYSDWLEEQGRVIDAHRFRNPTKNLLIWLRDLIN